MPAGVDKGAGVVLELIFAPCVPWLLLLRGSKHVQRPSGDAVLIARLQISPQGLRLVLARESRLVEADDPLHVQGVIIEELDPQVSGSMSNKAREVLGCGLGNGVEQGVPAADIGFQRVLDANAIAQLDVVMVTGTAAIGLVGSWRKEGTVDAMLHVKHGDLLVDYHLEPIWRHGVDQVEELGGVEIVRGCDSHGPPTLEELDGQGIGSVEREVGDERDPSLSAEVQSARVADENAVGPQLRQVAEQVRLEGLLDPRCGQVDRRAPRRAAATAAAYSLMSW